jgi:hypothetical protein
MKVKDYSGEIVQCVGDIYVAPGVIGGSQVHVVTPHYDPVNRVNYVYEHYVKLTVK